ncbi:hypothetical protein Acr_24g0013550 [Actinidia rufa]|uniref:Derlin n=1 Tax=Actinidia rufa TaxID=165716 RepID=A0A7J0GWD8_9ERIC|nr:hypothetical protein Acr_24g0013550 [Actinidia rufa]
MMVADLILGNSLKSDLLGMAAGHLYYLLTVLYPLSGGKYTFKTPLLVPWLDALAVLSFDAYLHAPTAVSVSRQLTQPCPYGVASSSLPTVDVSIRLVEQRHLGGNDGGPSFERHSSLVATVPSSGAEGLRARSVAAAGTDLRPSKTQAGCILGCGVPNERSGEEKPSSWSCFPGEKLLPKPGTEQALQRRHKQTLPTRRKQMLRNSPTKLME